MRVSEHLPKVPWLNSDGDELPACVLHRRIFHQFKSQSRVADDMSIDAGGEAIAAANDELETRTEFKGQRQVTSEVSDLG